MRETFVSSNKAGGHVGGVWGVTVKRGVGGGGAGERLDGFVTEVCSDSLPATSVVAFQEG